MVAALAVLSGCGSPDKANIEVRKKNQQLQEQIHELTTQREADLNRIRGLESQRGTLPVLAEDRLERLVTVQSFKIGRLTSGDAQGIKLYVVPTDANGEELKATGTWEVDAFDLADKEHPQIGHWEFGPDECKKNWVGFLLRTYIFPCPWPKARTHAQITLHVAFRDELTQRLLVPKDTVIKVELPPG